MDWNAGINRSIDPILRVIITLEVPLTSSTRCPPRAFTSWAVAIIWPMAIEAANWTADRSTITALIGAAASSWSDGEISFVPGVSRRPVITIRRRSSPMSSWVMVVSLVSAMVFFLLSAGREQNALSVVVIARGYYRRVR